MFYRRFFFSRARLVDESVLTHFSAARRRVRRHTTAGHSRAAKGEPRGGRIYLPFPGAAAAARACEDHAWLVAPAFGWFDDSARAGGRGPDFHFRRMTKLY